MSTVFFHNVNFSPDGKRYNQCVQKQEYHRFSGELWQGGEISHAPDIARRVALALGPQPLDNARHLLPEIALPPPFAPLAPGPQEGTDFIIDLVGRFPMPLSAVQAAFPPAQRGGLGFAQVWVQTERRPGLWQPLGFEGTEGRVVAVALSWELGSLLTAGREAIEELAGFVLRTGERGEKISLFAVPREAPADAAHRADALTALKLRFARAVEMRLLPVGRAFPARSVWRAVYALGLRWGDLDLFHWYDLKTGTRLFSINAIGPPGYFLPERAAEGEGTPGIALSFELPRCPAPLATYDRMGIALFYLWAAARWSPADTGRRGVRCRPS